MVLPQNTPLASALGDWGSTATPRGQRAAPSLYGELGGVEVSAMLDSARPGSAGSAADQLGSLQLQVRARQAAFRLGIKNSQPQLQ